jgi:hypothetical protein
MSASRYLLFTAAHGWLAVLVFGVAACPLKSSGKPPTKQRVLAEATTTYRHPGTFYLVGARAYPYTVTGAFMTRDSADRVAAPAEEVSGPYQGPQARPAWDVLSVTVRVRTADGREQTLQYDPRGVDAVFLTIQAVDKFMVPYYTTLYGRGFADSVRAAVIGGAPPKPPCHRYSFPCYPAPDMVPPN